MISSVRGVTEENWRFDVDWDDDPPMASYLKGGSNDRFKFF